MTVQAVADGKLTNEELGSFHRRVDEVKRRLNEETIPFTWVMNELQRVIEGRPPVANIVVDFCLPPMIPPGWDIRESDQMKSRFFGGWNFNLNNLELYRLDEQKQQRFISGNDLRNRLEGKIVMGAQLLDFLLANSYLVPEEWKKKTVLFWGTIYRDDGDKPCVRYLQFLDGSRPRWGWSYRLLDGSYGVPGSALVVSNTTVANS